MITNGPKLSCNIQYIFKHSDYVNHLIGFFTIYLFINLTKNQRPEIKLLQTLILYIFFMYTRKINIIFSFGYIFLSLIILIIQDFKEYYYNNKTIEKYQNKKNYNLITNIQYGICLIIISLFVLGFYLYTKNTIEDTGNKFSWKTYMLGNNLQCKALLKEKYDPKGNKVPNLFKKIWKKTITSLKLS